MLDPEFVAKRFRSVRARTDALTAALSCEDAMVQSMPDASPTKWHLAHTTWFFDEFVLSRFEGGHAWPDDRWRCLFNSYYDAVGPRHPRPERGVLSRPSLDEVRAYRKRVDDRMGALLPRCEHAALETALLGTHHEEQHQELILTDSKHALSRNPLAPAYLGGADTPARPAAAPPLSWVSFDEAVVEIGHAGASFAFDNETPRHRAVVGPFAVASRLVTNREYAEFVRDGGYARPELWLSDGWSARCAGGWSSPLYWRAEGDERAWSAFGPRGVRALDLDAPVAHVSHYEADAYARWADARLPTEEEWERAAASAPVEGNFVETGAFEPRVSRTTGLSQIFGDVWEWTGSAYLPYPRFRPMAGALGEYNGKFMSGQMVLRGGSCLSPRDHLRPTYRNFFPPTARWQMTGIRLARDL